MEAHYLVCKCLLGVAFTAVEGCEQVGLTSSFKEGSGVVKRFNYVFYHLDLIWVICDVRMQKI